MKMLTQKLILSYSSKIAMQVIQIAASIVVARIVGPTVLGTVAFGLAFVSVFAFLADLGIGSAHVKLVSEGQDIGKCVSTFAMLKFGNTSIFFIVVLAIFLVQKFALHVKFESTAHEYVIIIALLTVTIQQLLYIPVRTFAARTEQAKQDVPEFVRNLAYQGLRVLVVLLGYRAIALALGNLISTILIVPLVLYLFKDYPRAKFDKDLARKYISISLPILLMGMSTNVIHYLDKVILQYFTNSEQVGFYTAGYRIGELVLLIANSVGLLFFPLFSKAASENNFLYIKRTIDKFERFSFLFIMPVTIFLSLYSDVIVKVILGNQYLPSIPIMAIVNLSMFALVINTPYGNVVTGMGFFGLAALLNVVNLLLFVLLLYLLSSPMFFNMGALGVAIAVFVSTLFLGCLFRFYAKRKCPILDQKESLKFTMFAVIDIVGFYFFYTYLSKYYGTGFKIVFVFIYFGVTYVALFLLGWINRKDVQNLKEIVNLNKIGNYVVEEMRGK